MLRDSVLRLTISRANGDLARGHHAMNDTLYDEDIVLWSERQAALLRQRATGDLVNEAELDWLNSMMISLRSEQPIWISARPPRAISIINPIIPLRRVHPCA